MHSRPGLGGGVVESGHCPLPAPEARTTEHAHVACPQQRPMFFQCGTNFPGLADSNNGGVVSTWQLPHPLPRPKTPLP